MTVPGEGAPLCLPSAPAARPGQRTSRYVIGPPQTNAGAARCGGLPPRGSRNWPLSIFINCSPLYGGACRDFCDKLLTLNAKSHGQLAPDGALSSKSRATARAQQHAPCMPFRERIC